MAKSISKFIVSLKDESHFKPKFVVSVVPQKEDPNSFLVRIIHPNANDPDAIKDPNSPEAKARAKDPVAKAAAFDKKIVYSKMITAKNFSEALAEGKKMLDLPELLAIDTTYEEKKHIPQPRRGKMKLHLKEDYDREQKELHLLDEDAEELDLPLSEDDEVVEIDDSALYLPAKNKTKKEILKPVAKKAKSKKEKEVVKVKKEKQKKVVAKSKNKKATKVVKKPVKKVKNNKKK